MIAWFIIALATIGLFAFIAVTGASTINATETASSRAQTISRLNTVVDMLASQSAAPFADGVVYAPAGQVNSDGYLLPTSMQSTGITSFGTKFTYCPVGGTLASSNATAAHPGGTYNIRVAEAAGKRYVTQSNLTISGAIDPNTIAFVMAPIDSRATLGGCNQITRNGNNYTVPGGIVRALSRNVITDLDSTMQSGGAVWFVTPQGNGDGSSWSNAANLSKAFEAYQKSLGGSFVIRLSEGTYNVDGNPLDQSSMANPNKTKGSSLTLISPTSARLNIGQINAPSDLTFDRVFIEESTIYVNTDRTLKAINSSLGNLVLMQGSKANFFEAVSIKAKSGMTGAIYQQAGSSLNVRYSNLTIAYQSGSPSIYADSGSQTTIEGSTVDMRPGPGSEGLNQGYGFYYNPNSKISVASSVLNVNGSTIYPFYISGSMGAQSMTINSNAFSLVALGTVGGVLKLDDIVIAGTTPSRYAILGTNNSTIYANGDLTASFRCWSKESRSMFRYSDYGVAGGSSAVSADEAQLPTSANPTAQQARDAIATSNRNADRAILRSRMAGKALTCRQAQPATTYVKCADEGGYCDLPYYATVRYGLNGSYNTLQRGGGVPCNNETFGDPLVGTVKECSYLSDLN